MENRLYKTERKIIIDQNTTPAVIYFWLFLIILIVGLLMVLIILFLILLSPELASELAIVLQPVKHMEDRQAIEFALIFLSAIYFNVFLGGKFSNLEKLVKRESPYEGPVDKNYVVTLVVSSSVCLYQIYAFVSTIMLLGK